MQYNAKCTHTILKQQIIVKISNFAWILRKPGINCNLIIHDAKYCFSSNWTIKFKIFSINGNKNDLNHYFLLCGWTNMALLIKPYLCYCFVYLVRYLYAHKPILLFKLFKLPVFIYNVCKYVKQYCCVFTYQLNIFFENI